VNVAFSLLAVLCITVAVLGSIYHYLDFKAVKKEGTKRMSVFGYALVGLFVGFLYVGMWGGYFTGIEDFNFYLHLAGAAAYGYAGQRLFGEFKNKVLKW
jgi:hypothetical protein